MHYMKRYVILWLAFVSMVSSSLLYGMYQTPKHQRVAQKLWEQRRNLKAQLPKTQGLLIFLDDTETKNNPGGVMGVFERAMLEKAGPIIASASLLKVLYTEKRSQRSYDKAFFVQLKKDHKEGTITSDEFNRILREIKLSLLKFNVNDWIIKGIENPIYPYLYLLIPKSYLQDRNIKLEDVTRVIENSNLTATELKLGLKVNHMYNMTIDEWTGKMYGKPTNPLENVGNGNESLVFVTNKEYKRYVTALPPTWALYLNGHGTFEKTIADVPLGDFEQFLTFLEKNIRTNLLYYFSCFGAGLNNKKLYEDSERAVTRTYPFVIITQALTDAVVGSRFLALKTHSDGTLSLEKSTMFTTFFDEVEHKDLLDYHAIAKALSFKIEVGNSGWSLPQVKLPGLEWFSVTDTDKAVSIGNVMAQHRKEPLDIATFFKKRGQKSNPEAILLYAKDIPFELIINTWPVPVIVSMIPGDAEHHIKKISSNVHSVNLILQEFLTFRHLRPTKIFLIDEIVGKNHDSVKKLLQTDDELIALKDITITLSFDEKAEKEVYVTSFTHNGNRYRIENNKAGLIK